MPLAFKHRHIDFPTARAHDSRASRTRVRKESTQKRLKQQRRNNLIAAKELRKSLEGQEKRRCKNVMDSDTADFGRGRAASVPARSSEWAPPSHVSAQQRRGSPCLKIATGEAEGSPIRPQFSSQRGVATNIYSAPFFLLPPRVQVDARSENPISATREIPLRAPSFTAATTASGLRGGRNPISWSAGRPVTAKFRPRPSEKAPRISESCPRAKGLGARHLTRRTE